MERPFFAVREKGEDVRIPPRACAAQTAGPGLCISCRDPLIASWGPSRMQTTLNFANMIAFWTAEDGAGL
jgi:hypothetical protein